MDEQQSRIQEDLRGLLDGDVHCDDIVLQLYASDASIYQVKPLGVVFPRSKEDVAVTVRYAHENQIPVHARGAGTGLAGESLGPGLVIDFSRHMRRIIATEDETVRVQPGVVHERLNTHLKAQGRHFGPDPAMSHVTTMGSVVAIDASGSHWLKYGSARRHVVSLEAVLADGTLVECGRESMRRGYRMDDSPEDRKQDMVDRVGELIQRNDAMIASKQPQSRTNRAGYNLGGVLEGGTLDLPKLLTGSEGTLALFTEMTLATQPLPRHRGLAMLFFDRLESAARAVQEILTFSPSACDLMDRRHLSLAREAEPRYDLLIPAQTEALLLVEQEGADPVEVSDRLRQVVDRVRRRKKMAFDTRQAFDAQDVELFWQLARRVVPTLYRLKGSTRPLPFVEDIAVPPESLPDFLVQLQNILKGYQVTASVFGHAGHGQLHVRPFLDLDDPQDVRKMEQLASDVYSEVFDVGGTISGEHGDGLSRTPFIRRQYGELYSVFQDVKRIFDPDNILNPGKIVGADATQITRHLRPASGVFRAPPAPDTTNGEPPARRPFAELQLQWKEHEFVDVVRNCNGCGACRSLASDVRMCPINRFAPSEEASPRAKANLLRGILAGQLDPATVEQDEFKRIADLCVNCKMCHLECPAEVDIPRLMIEAKGAYVATNGLRPSDWMTAHIDSLSALGCRFSPLANWAIRNPRARWLIERVLGIAQGRKLPRFASSTFLQRARRRRLHRPTRRTGPKVLYFVDTYANYHDPQLAEALVAVLEHNGVSVYVHSGQTASGMALVTVGAIPQARRVAQHNVRLLAEAIRQGYEVVASEPSAAICLKQEYPHLLDDDDARLVADHTSDACAYLWQLHRSGKLKLDLRPVNASLGYHTPCHLKALGVGTPGENLLRLVPGLRVQLVERGCSGMAGTYGLKRENFRNSLRAGWSLISALRHSSLQAGTTECSACKMQMEQGANKTTIHPLKLLALAYGLMPDIASLLTVQTEDLVVT